MPAAALAEDTSKVSTGHGCDGTTTIKGTLQTTVRINGIIAAVKDDVLTDHTILSGDVCVPHTAYVNAGSSTVKIAGIPVARVDDSADGNKIISGSDNVNIGG